MRLLGALILIGLHRAPTALQWGYLYCGCTMITAMHALYMVTTRLGSPKGGYRFGLTQLREGSFFSVGLSAQTIYNDIDKTMLVRLSTLEAAGIYGAAYRLIDVSFTPVTALLYAAYARFFREGERGIESSVSYASRLIVRAAGYSGVICIGVLLFAGLVPVVLGSEYRDTVEALRWLAVLPIFKSIHYFLSDTLTSVGYQWLRSAIQVGVACFNIAINLWLIPRYSWRGAAWSSIASDALLAAAIGSAVLVVQRRTRQELALTSSGY
jgi:O-antigen/teichoic acid export membrane protein